MILSSAGCPLPAGNPPLIRLSFDADITVRNTRFMDYIVPFSRADTTQAATHAKTT